MKSATVLGVVAALVLVGARPTAAQGWRGPGAGRAPFAGLDLTADQQKKVSDLRDEVDRKVVPLREQLSARSSELRELWSAPQPDRQAIASKQAQAAELRKHMLDLRTSFRLASLGVLTPAQRQTMQAASPAGGRGPGGGCQSGAACAQNGGGDCGGAGHGGACGGGWCGGSGHGGEGCGGGQGRGHRHGS